MPITRTIARDVSRCFGLSLCFVAGFSTVFIALGAGATALGQLLLRYRYEANIVGGIIVIIFGLFMIGMLKLPWLQRDLRFHADINRIPSEFLKEGTASSILASFSSMMLRVRRAMILRTMPRTTSVG